MTTTTDEQHAGRQAKTAAVAARIPADMADELRRRADARGLTMSDVVGAAIRSTLVDDAEGER